MFNLGVLALFGIVPQAVLGLEAPKLVNTSSPITLVTDNNEPVQASGGSILVGPGVKSGAYCPKDAPDVDCNKYASVLTWFDVSGGSVEVGWNGTLGLSAAASAQGIYVEKVTGFLKFTGPNSAGPQTTSTAQVSFQETGILTNEHQMKAKKHPGHYFWLCETKTPGQKQVAIHRAHKAKCEPAFLHLRYTYRGEPGQAYEYH